MTPIIYKSLVIAAIRAGKERIMSVNIRVAIPIIGGDSWYAGVSLVESIVKAAAYLPEDERPQLFLVVTNDTLPSFSLHQPFISYFDAVIFVGNNIINAQAVIKMPFIHYISMDELFEKIDLLFPVNTKVYPGHCAASWIPDFQHRYLPSLFSQKERDSRDKTFGEIAAQAQLIMVTSRAVEKDFHEFYPSSAAVTKVLVIPTLPNEEWYSADSVEVQKKYGIPDRFILCCNQFWTHKNHIALFKAIALIRSQGQDVHLVCTGFNHDYRDPDYFSKLQQMIVKLGITDLIHILGLIPRHDQIQLIRRSMFVVQPSLFEGLSMIVQECQVLGKTIIVSDLDVHVEHEYGIYFQRTNFQDLAQKISALLPASQPGPDLPREIQAKIENTTKMNSFSQELYTFIKQSQIIFNKTPQPTNSKTATPLPNIPTITLATSLTISKNLDIQKQAISSWVYLGFKVVSINASDELTVLQPHFPNVEFVAAQRDARANYGKPYIYFDDILSYLAKQDCRICGIVNSDIHFLRENLPALIYQNVLNSLVFGSRIDIVSLDAPAEGQIFDGFDYFFFDNNILPRFLPEDFCIGLPWWDYWLPLNFLSNKRTIKKITTPIAYHIIHPCAYNLDSWRVLGLNLAKFYGDRTNISDDILADLQHSIFSVIQTSAIPISLT